MKKVLLALLMSITFCSSFVLGGCKKDDNFSLDEMKKLFVSSINEVVVRLEKMEEAIETMQGIDGDDLYVSVHKGDRVAFYGIEGVYTISPLFGNLIYVEYDSEGSEYYLNIETVEENVDLLKNNIVNAKFAEYRGYLVDLSTGTWTLKDEEASKINSKNRIDSIYFYESYLKLESRDSSTNIDVEWYDGFSYTGGYESVQSAKVYTPDAQGMNEIELVGLLDLPKNSSPESEIIKLGVQPFYWINDGVIKSGYQKQNFVYFSRDLTTLTVAEDEYYISESTFNAYRDLIQLQNIVVDSNGFYSSYLSDFDFIDKDLLPVIYLKEDIQVEETDEFLTFYQVVITDKTGYVKYAKK